MPPFKQVNASDNVKDNAETVGSVNLRDMLQDKQHIRGTFSINGRELRDFEARSPGEVVRNINAAVGGTGVVASLDDQYHLVLVGDGPDEIAIASGLGGDRQRQQRAIEDRNRANLDFSKRPPQAEADMDQHTDILELLGLEETAELNAARGGQDWQPGVSAEERQKRRADDRSRGVIGRQRSIMGGASPADDARLARDQGKLGAVGTTTLNQGPSNTIDADPKQAPGAVGGPPPSGGAPDAADHHDDGMGQSPPTQPGAGSGAPGKQENPSL